MKKLFDWCNNHIFLLCTIVLLVGIPLYPKLPLIDLRYTWVYIRAEDFFVFGACIIWLIGVIKKNVSLQTPLTIPIFLFWIIGAVATIHGVLSLVPSIRETGLNVILLSYLRRIEYMVVFFIAYTSMKDKKQFPWIIGVMFVTFVCVVLYGIGQRYMAFPAFLTMNEEFAKGAPITLSALSRVSSTFGGHYDLAAYLVLVMPIFFSILFATKNRVTQFFLLGSILMGWAVVFMTVSRISFIALFVAFGVVLFVQKKALVVASLILSGVAFFVLVTFSPGLLNRFTSTLKEVTVVVDAKTGQPIGHITAVPRQYFDGKVVRQKFSKSITDNESFTSTAAGILVDYSQLPESVDVLTEPNVPNGENLPQGTGYVNLPLLPIVRKVSNFLYEPQVKEASDVHDVFFINGDYLVKKVFAYDLSFTTRFQGEWPHAFAAFQKNIFIGSGYGAVGMAVDNSLLRMLGETGLFGFISFIVIFIVAGIFVRVSFASIDSPLVKSFLVGFAAGIVGLYINATFIDVFEASKVAFMLWLFMGVAVGIVSLYMQKQVSLYPLFLRVITSTPAVAVYFLIFTGTLYAPMIGNNFVAHDFIWLRRALECRANTGLLSSCSSIFSALLHYATTTYGPVYEPGTALYFYIMSSLFRLNQTMYHGVSLLIHGGVVVVVYLLAKRMFTGKVLPALAVGLFILSTGYAEAVQWISSTNVLFSTWFSLLSLYLFFCWTETKKQSLLIGFSLSYLCATLFHETGIFTPFYFVLYTLYTGRMKKLSQIFVSTRNKIIGCGMFLYTVWFIFLPGFHIQPDTFANSVHLPGLLVARFFGYIALMLIGQDAYPLSHALHSQFLRFPITGFLSLIFVVWIIGMLYKKYISSTWTDHQKQAWFGLAFSLISLSSLVLLYDISSHYVYMATVGFVLFSTVVLDMVYGALVRQGKFIARLSVCVVLSVYCLVHVVQLQRSHADWLEAGVIVQRFFISINAAYGESWSSDAMVLHFVGMPVRSGQAWVFPDGVGDALWLVFKNPRIHISTWNTLDEAYAAVGPDNNREKIFELEGGGNLIEKMRNPKSPIQ